MVSGGRKLDQEVYITGYARTPFGRFFGALHDIEGHRLAARCIDDGLIGDDRASLPVDVLYAGVGMASAGVYSPARRAVLASRLPQSTPSVAVDLACGSGMAAVGLGWKDIRAGLAGLAVCGGFESLSRTPVWLQRQRRTAPGDPSAWQPDEQAYNPLSLQNPVAGKAIADYTGQQALSRGIGREQQDDWALCSHERYFAAERRGFFAAERFALDELGIDEVPRAGLNREALARLPVLYSSPTVTAGNAPALSDGAAFLSIASAVQVKNHGLRKLARIIDFVSIAGDPTSSTRTPAMAIGCLLQRNGLQLDSVAVLEINEAYAATLLVSTLELAGGDGRRAQSLRARTNINGGALAIGHPMGASGARITMTLVSALHERGGGIGIASICGAFGQADAVLLEVDDHLSRSS